MSSEGPDDAGRTTTAHRGRIIGPHVPAARRLAAAAVPGLVLAAAVATVADWEVVPLLWWDATAALFLLLEWLSIRGLDAHETARTAAREDPSRRLTDTVVLGASVASLVAVGALLIGAGDDTRSQEVLQIGLAVASVALSWAVVHVVYALRYARLFYRGTPGGVDFKSEEDPRYTDFAYLAFTIGMTYQVSDTDLRTGELRAAVLRHAMLSFVFGTLIIATTINLVAGLAR